MHQYDLVSRTGDDRPAFLLSARGRGPPATRKMTELTNKKLLNLQEEYFMKKFIKKITHMWSLIAPATSQTTFSPLWR